MNIQDFKFTFETEIDQDKAERIGYIEAYDCVRMEVRPTGHLGSIDFPVKNRERFNRYLKVYEGQILNIYPTVHSYDIEDYL